MSSTISTAYPSMSLASYFATTTTSSTSSSSSSSNLASLLENNLGTFNSDLLSSEGGSTILATVDELKNATSPVAKLNLSSSVAKSVLIQADASVRTNNSSRASDIADQAQLVLTSLSEAVTGLGTSNVSAYSDTIASTLKTVNTALQQVANMASSGTDEENTELQSTLKSLDSLGAQIASSAKVSWSTITDTSANTVSGDVDSTSSEFDGVSNLINILA